jgi:hypothetical protein
MATAGGPNIETDGLVLKLDTANIKSFRGEPTTNTIAFPSAGANRYNNPGFSGTIVNTGETFRGSPIWEVTFIPQDSGRVPRLGSTEGFGFFHSMGINLLPNTSYMASIYVRSEYPLLNNSTQGFINTYSNISGWGAGGTSTTQLREGEWTRLYTRYFNNIVVGGVNYSQRGISNTLNAIVNTTQTTQVLVTVTIQSNGTFSTSTEYGTSTAGGSIIQFNEHAGLYSASPTITVNGEIVGLSTGTSAIINHGLNTSTFTKLSTSNPVLKTNYPFQYFILMNVPSTGGINRTISFRLDSNGFYTSLSDNKFWKATFDVSNLQVNNVIRTYWTAPMIEQHSRNLPSRFTTGTRGTTVATGGGWIDTSGNNNHGELVNNPVFSNDNLGSLQFDGVDDRVNCGTTLGNFGTSNFTINFFFKTTTTLTPSTFIAKSIGGNPTAEYGWLINNGSNGLNLGFAVATVAGSWGSAGSYSIQTSGANIRNGVWQMATIVGDRSQPNVSIYLNGILQTLQTYVGASSFTTIGNITNNQILTIGSESDTNTPHPINSSMSQIQIYNRALTASKILQNYNAAKSRFGL